MLFLESQFLLFFLHGKQRELYPCLTISIKFEKQLNSLTSNSQLSSLRSIALRNAAKVFSNFKTPAPKKKKKKKKNLIS